MLWNTLPDCLTSDFPEPKFVSAVRIPHPRVVTPTRTPRISAILSSQAQIFKDPKPIPDPSWLRWHIICVPQQPYLTETVDNNIIIKYHPVSVLSNINYPRWQKMNEIYQVVLKYIFPVHPNLC